MCGLPPSQGDPDPRQTPLRFRPCNLPLEGVWGIPPDAGGIGFRPFRTSTTLFWTSHVSGNLFGAPFGLILVTLVTLVTLVCFRFSYKTDGGSNGPILVPISRQHYLPDPVNQGNHVVYPPLFAIPHSSAGSPLALSGTPSASYHAA